MITITNKNECTGCYACQNICPNNCINLIEDDYGFRYPEVDLIHCINCHLCENVCPAKTTITPSKNKPISAYAAYSLDNKIRAKSSSGGIFSLVASTILINGGYVSGAIFDKCFSVQHIVTSNNLDQMMGSKYVQSDIGLILNEIKALLDEGKTVLFSGTPCQVAGLLSVLGEKYENLLTQDIVCHGVPSMLLWDKYILYLESMFKSKIKSINMRDKSTGWKGYSVKIQFHNGKVYKKKSRIRLFFSSLSIKLIS